MTKQEYLERRQNLTDRLIENTGEDRKLESWQDTKSGKTVATIIRLTIDLANEKSKEVYRETRKRV